MHDSEIRRAAALIAQADSLLITAGAGMGVDSGLPDFRGEQGFWQAYPALGAKGLRFAEVASPQTFHEDPRLAWGFYGHRLQLYRDTQPHAGFGILQRWAAQKPNGGFVFTSNVDGQFQRSGWDAQRMLECHGSIHHLQCLNGCRAGIWRADNLQVTIDTTQCQWLGELPRCTQCASLARPNILMFGDSSWLDARCEAQEAALQQWLARVERPVVVEMGAGTAIPTVRLFGERLGAPLVRINVREPEVRSRPSNVGLAMGALAALSRIDAQLSAADPA